MRILLFSCRDTAICDWLPCLLKVDAANTAHDGSKFRTGKCPRKFPHLKKNRLRGNFLLFLYGKLYFHAILGFSLVSETTIDLQVAP